MGYPQIINNAMFDYLDEHGYWQHPSIASVTRAKNDPMVNDPADSTVVQFARTPMVGKPFVVSETNHRFPHIYVVEGIALLTAYAMLLQSGIDRHGFTHKRWIDFHAQANSTWAGHFSILAFQRAGFTLHRYLRITFELHELANVGSE
jgi:hypothetical protein